MLWQDKLNVDESGLYEYNMLVIKQVFGLPF